MIHVIDMKHHTYANKQSFVGIQKNASFISVALLENFFEMVKTKL